MDRIDTFHIGSLANTIGPFQFKSSDGIRIVAMVGLFAHQPACGTSLPSTITSYTRHSIQYLYWKLFSLHPYPAKLQAVSVNKSLPSGWSFSCTNLAKGRPLRPDRSKERMEKLKALSADSPEKVVTWSDQCYICKHNDNQNLWLVCLISAEVCTKITGPARCMIRENLKQNNAARCKSYKDGCPSSLSTHFIYEAMVFDWSRI